MQTVIALVGATGVGKTAVSLELAEKLNAEIISADSMQVYRGMDIGTAKATLAEQQRVRHHLLDIADPGEEFSVARYQQLARAAIAEIEARGKLPLFVGGSGLYLRAALTAYEFAPVPADTAYRESLYARAAVEGTAVLHSELALADPDAALKISVNDARRIIRALEVYYNTGERISERQKRTEAAASLYDAIWLGLTRERSDLYKRIDRRVEQMVSEGLIEEVQRLIEQGICFTNGINSRVNAGQALGYKEILPYLNGECSKAEAIAALQQSTRRYAKRQMTWFNAEKRIIWHMLDEESEPSAVAERLMISLGGVINHGTKR